MIVMITMKKEMDTILISITGCCLVVKQVQLVTTAAAAAAASTQLAAIRWW